MASEEPVMLESYVVDAGRKCKIRCCSRDHVILFVQAVKMFSGDTFWMGEDKLVAYGTGDELTSDCAFREHRYYMYLKKGEVFTDDPKFDVKVMACQNPPGRPLPLVNYLFKEQAVGIYRDLIVNKKYLQNGYLEAIEIPKLQLMAPTWSDILFKAMKRSIPEMPVKEVIMAADEIATMASNRIRRTRSRLPM